MVNIHRTFSILFPVIVIAGSVLIEIVSFLESENYGHMFWFAVFTILIPLIWMWLFLKEENNIATTLTCALVVGYTFITTEFSELMNYYVLVANTLLTIVGCIYTVLVPFINKEHYPSEFVSDYYRLTLIAISVFVVVDYHFGWHEPWDVFIIATKAFVPAALIWFWSYPDVTVGLYVAIICTAVNGALYYFEYIEDSYVNYVLMCWPLFSLIFVAIDVIVNGRPNNHGFTPEPETYHSPTDKLGGSNGGSTKRSSESSSERKEDLYSHLHHMDEWGNTITLDDIHYAESRGIDINSRERLNYAENEIRSGRRSR